METASLIANLEGQNNTRETFITYSEENSKTIIRWIGKTTQQCNIAYKLEKLVHIVLYMLYMSPKSIKQMKNIHYVLQLKIFLHLRINKQY